MVNPATSDAPLATTPGQRRALQLTAGVFLLAALGLCWPLWPMLLMAVWTATLAHPLLLRLERLVRGRRAAAGLLALLVFLGLALPLYVAALLVSSAIRDLAASVGSAPSVKAALETFASGGAASDVLRIPASVDDLVALMNRHGSSIYALGTRLAGVATQGVVGAFVYLAATITLLLEGEAAWAWTLDHSPLRRDHLTRFAGAFRETGSGLLFGVGLTTATQALVATLAYVALGVPRAALLGPLTGVASVVPVVGSALIWGPISLAFAASGSASKAIAVALVGALIISTADNVLKPIFARVGALRMHMFLLFVSIFGGIATLGAWGAVVGPLVLRLAIEALALLRENERSNAS